MADHAGTGALGRGVELARALKVGTWQSVEALAVLAAEAAEAGDRATAASLRETAAAGAARLKAGTWEAVQALAWLSRAERLTGS